jgi:hypothetical protein
MASLDAAPFAAPDFDAVAWADALCRQRVLGESLER